MEFVHDKENATVSINGVEFSEHYVFSTLLPSMDDIGDTFRVAKIDGKIVKVRVIPRTLLGSYRVAIGMKWMSILFVGGAALFFKSALLAGVAATGLIVYGAAALVIAAIGSASDYFISEVKFLPKDPIAS